MRLACLHFTIAMSLLALLVLCMSFTLSLFYIGPGDKRYGAHIFLIMHVGKWSNIKSSQKNMLSKHFKLQTSRPKKVVVNSISLSKAKFTWTLFWKVTLGPQNFCLVFALSDLSPLFVRLADFETHFVCFV